MHVSHILRTVDGWLIRLGLTSVGRTFCGTPHNPDTPENAPVCEDCQRLAGWGKDIPLSNLPSCPSLAAFHEVVSRAVSEDGYLLQPIGTTVWRRVGRREIHRVSGWEAAALHHLLHDNFLTRGGLVLVQDGRGGRHMYEVECPL
jgi:hypothetical protein